MSMFSDTMGQASDFTDEFFGEPGTYIPYSGDPSTPVQVSPIGREVLDEEGLTTIRTDQIEAWFALTLPGLRNDVVVIDSGAFAGRWVVNAQTDIGATRQLLLLFREDEATA